MEDTEFFNIKKWYLGKNVAQWVNCYDSKIIGTLVRKHQLELTKKIRKDVSNLFTLCYLNPDLTWNNGVTTEMKREEIENYFSWCDVEIIKKRILNMPYKDFLRTLYWDFIRTLKKEQANYKCELCNNNTHLNVHHKSYNNHGDEYHHLEDLIVLCSDCHSKFHEKLAEVM